MKRTQCHGRSWCPRSPGWAAPSSHPHYVSPARHWNQTRYGYVHTDRTWLTPQNSLEGLAWFLMPSQEQSQPACRHSTCHIHNQESIVNFQKNHSNRGSQCGQESIVKFHGNYTNSGVKCEKNSIVKFHKNHTYRSPQYKNQFSIFTEITPIGVPMWQRMNCHFSTDITPIGSYCDKESNVKFHGNHTLGRRVPMWDLFYSIIDH